MNTLAMLYVTFPDEDTARTTGKTLLESGLIACFNYFPIQSMYFWKGKIEEGKEIIGLIKTDMSRVSECREMITSLHPYDVPCILSSDWESNVSYCLWIREVTLLGPEKSE